MKTAKYLFWKVIIHLLLMVMSMVFGVPLCAVLSMNGIDGKTTAIAVSLLALVIFILLQYWLIGRSDLSGISMKNYIWGECAAFALLTLLFNGILAVVSKGNAPIATSYASFPVFLATELSGNILFGSIAMIAGYLLAVFFLYLLKKRKDPTLMGRNKNKNLLKKDETADD